MTEAFIATHPLGSAVETRSDVALIESVTRRDQRAISELYCRYSRLLYGLIVRVLRDQTDAEDVLQEVFVQLWTRADTYSAAVGSPCAWLVGIARNRAIDRIRANGARFSSTTVSSLSVTRESASRACSTEQLLALARALDGLPGDQRVLIEQAYFLGLTQAELAERHELPLGTVKTRIRTGMQALRQQLA